MRVVFCSAELAPIVRVGGLAEAASGLVRALRAEGVDLTVAVPDYFDTPLEDERRTPLAVPEWAGPVMARTGVFAADPALGEVTLIDAPLLRRSHPYMRPDGALGWPDNDKRFMGFSAACAALAHGIDADVLHANDWHTGPTLGLVESFGANAIGTVFSIHNLAYQGECDLGWADVLPPAMVAAYTRGGACNPMAGALRVADRIVAVSPTYAAEIRTAAHGAGLDDILESRSQADRHALVGIRNGIDTAEWDPRTDTRLVANYALADFTVPDPSAKAACRADLADRLDLGGGDGPVIGMVTRLVEQKGLDVVARLVPYLDGIDGRLALIGSGEPHIAAEIRLLAARFPRIRFVEGYDISLSHKVFGGADLYLMPSRFEPCGLAQMQAMAYGALPIVTAVGGLRDTVIDADLDAQHGNGFVAREPDAVGMIDALHRAVRAWADKARRLDIVRRGMSTDWSWQAPAREYIALYANVVATRKRG